mmetsp:Transcript_17780/g.58186  ORF Transcript_17780/g.58186 Transcript_17780/m.58186 type:complete len:98 (-) Transcript_17780:2346-2639(-)
MRSHVVSAAHSLLRSLRCCVSALVEAPAAALLRFDDRPPRVARPLSVGPASSSESDPSCSGIEGAAGGAATAAVAGGATLSAGGGGGGGGDLRGRLL